MSIRSCRHTRIPAVESPAFETIRFLAKNKSCSLCARVLRFERIQMFSFIRTSLLTLSADQSTDTIGHCCAAIPTGYLRSSSPVIQTVSGRICILSGFHFVQTPRFKLCKLQSTDKVHPN